MTARNRTLGSIDADVVIVGGGVAGLWLLNLLTARGDRVLLVERSAFGDGQSIRSQGIIHGGVKYALGGALTKASEALVAMPSRWRDCLAGRGDVDLRGVRVTSRNCYLWTANDGTLGRLGALLASRLLHGRVRRLARREFPAAFSSPSFTGAVYELDELVLDPRSLLERLSAPHRARTLTATVAPGDFVRAADGTLEAIRIGDRAVHARAFVLAAGEGNEALATAIAGAPAMQRRPLQQVIVRSNDLPELFGHCIDPASGTEPRMTVTSHADATGRPVWYVGGRLASRGATKSSAELIDEARAELRACVPWIDLTPARFDALRIDRAEPREADARRPDDAYVRSLGTTLICWPTKLALVPSLGDQVLAALTHAPRPDGAFELADMPHPAVATPPWLVETGGAKRGANVGG